MDKLQKKHAALFIDVHTSILNAIKHMDKTHKKLLIVTKKSKFHSLISIGDIQRAVINNTSFETPIEKILRGNIEVAKKGDDVSIIKKTMFKHRVEFMPVIDNQGNLINIYLWEDFFSTEQKREKKQINLPVIIMAGGKGTRLKPITNILPKALIPIGEKTILEHIMDRFFEIGCDDFHLSVNYKADMIRHYFKTVNPADFKISYFEEEKPLGTVGSLFLIKNKINTTFFITNCDIIIEEDYNEIYNYHKENQNELTIVSVLKHYPIPYGILDTSVNGILKELKEKPELTFKINSGMYMLEPNLIHEIPENTFFHITDLISNIQKRGGKIGVFPVSEGSWKDIGDWEEYLSHIK